MKVAVLSVVVVVFQVLSVHLNHCRSQQKVQGKMMQNWELSFLFTEIRSGKYYLCQNMVPLWSGCTGQHVFCAEPRLEFCWEIRAGLSAAP